MGEGYDQEMGLKKVWFKQKKFQQIWNICKKSLISLYFILTLKFKLRMKQLLIFLFAIVGMSSVQAQSTISDVATYPYFLDTISTSSSADTLTFTQMYDRAYPFHYEALIQADSLSGGTTATVYIQQAAKGRSTWVTIDSYEINGVKSYARKTGYCLGGRIRYYILAPSSTQSTRVLVNHQIVRSVPTRE